MRGEYKPFNREFFRKPRKFVTEYYIPELDKWVNGKVLPKYLSELGKTIIDYYNECNLEKDENGDFIIPRCNLDGCECQCKFLTLGRGYSRYCCRSHQVMDEDKITWKSEDIGKKNRKMMSDRIKFLRSDESSTYNSEEYKDKHRREVTRSIHDPRHKRHTEEYKRRSSEVMKEIWRDPKFAENQYKNNPFYSRNKGSVSKESINPFIEIMRKLPNHIKPLDIKLGVSEKRVAILNKQGNKTFRKLDFYIPSLNKWIEFNGDYWHRNPKNAALFSSDSIKAAEIWVKDKDRIKAVSKVLGTKPLIIWESDYRSDPEGTVSRCLDFILDREGGSLCQQN